MTTEERQLVNAAAAVLDVAADDGARAPDAKSERGIGAR